jgi:hypothetical protein
LFLGLADLSVYGTFIGDRLCEIFSDIYFEIFVRGRRSGGAEERRSGGAEERRSGGSASLTDRGAEERRSGGVGAQDSIKITAKFNENLDFWL